MLATVREVYPKASNCKRGLPKKLLVASDFARKSTVGGDDEISGVDQFQVKGWC
jgi:hypothetical protein